MIKDKEKLTNATMAALQGQVEEEIDTKEQCKKELKKVVEEYIRDNNLSDVLDIFVTATTEEELFDILRQLVNNYDNYNKIEL